MATILPTGETTFFDGNGNPLAGGKVFFYIPDSTTFKDTYQDSDQNVVNTNPVILDSAGRAIIFGSGTYRQVVFDAIDNLIWDQVTAEPNTGNVSYGGTSTGSANAQIVSSGTFDGSDGSTLYFVAGFSNTGAMTLTVGDGSPIPVLKNSAGGPIALVAGDIVSGNIYSVSYSTSLASFLLLLSTPTSYTIADKATAEAGTDNTSLMSPLRTFQATNQARDTIASGTTTNLATLTSQTVTVTGTATITSFGTVTAGVRKDLFFSSSLTIRYSSDKIDTANSQDIAVTAGGNCSVLSLGGGKWVVYNYQQSALANSGFAPLYAARAWWNFSGSTTPPTLRTSGNVTSITDHQVGDYTVNFTTALSSANYGFALGVGDPGVGVGNVCIMNGADAPTPSSIRIITCIGGSSTRVDRPYITGCVFR